MKARIDDNWVVYQEENKIFVENEKKKEVHQIGTADRELDAEGLTKIVEGYLSINNMLFEEEEAK